LLADDDLLVVAVADGVSEGVYSQVAAETAARSACKVVVDQLDRNGGVDWNQVARRISLRIIDEAEYRQISAPPASATVDQRLAACLATMSTTLVVAVVHRLPKHGGFRTDLCVVAGDSGVYLLRDGALVQVVGGKADSESITTGSVRPLPGNVHVQPLTIDLLPGDVLMVGTDGFGDPVGDGAGEVGTTIATRWVQPPTIDRFFADVNFYRRSYDDDRTVVSLWVHPDTELPAEPASAAQDRATEPRADVDKSTEVAPLSPAVPPTLAAESLPDAVGEPAEGGTEVSTLFNSTDQPTSDTPTRPAGTSSTDLSQAGPSETIVSGGAPEEAPVAAKEAPGSLAASSGFPEAGTGVSHEATGSRPGALGGSDGPPDPPRALITATITRMVLDRMSPPAVNDQNVAPPPPEDV
jgi:hypothetical protein